MSVKHKRQTVIRQLQPGDAVPAGEAKRYRAGSGYIRLRWKVGVYEYVETYEHRLVAGIDSEQVHHKNRRKDDNSRDNLAPLTQLDHSSAHSRVDLTEAASLYLSGWSLKRLGLKYGIGHISIMRSLKRRGVKMRTLSESWKFRRTA